jgi:hypothetical protein
MERADLLAALSLTASVVACAVVVAMLVHVAQSLREIVTSRPQPQGPAMVGAAFAFGLLGIVTGMMLAASRVPVVDAVLPAILTFAGATAAILVSSRRAEAPVALCATVAFATLLFLGTALGSFERQKGERAAADAVYDLDRLRWQAEAEFAVNAYRDALGLPLLSFPGTVAPAEPAAKTD